jgi:hypothetical protein
MPVWCKFTFKDDDHVVLRDITNWRVYGFKHKGKRPSTAHIYVEGFIDWEPHTYEHLEKMLCVGIRQALHPVHAKVYICHWLYNILGTVGFVNYEKERYNVYIENTT